MGRPHREETLSRQSLIEYRQRLQTMDSDSLDAEYRRLHGRCAYSPRRVADAIMIQEFVQVWRELRRRQHSALKR